MSDFGNEVTVRQPPPIHAPGGLAKTVRAANPFAKTMIGGKLRGKLMRGKAGAELRAANKAMRAAQKANRGALKGLKAQRRAIRGLEAKSKRALRAKRRELREVKARLRALKKANPGSDYNRARGGRKAAGSSRKLGGGGFISWVMRKALRAFKARGVGDGRNHGFTGVRRSGRTGLAGR